MRSSLLKFERFMLASFVIGIVMVVLPMNYMFSALNPSRLEIAIIQLVGLLITLGVVSLMSRKKSKIVKVAVESFCQ